MKNLESEIRDKIIPLLDKGFELSHEEASGSFDQAMLVFNYGNHTRVRIIRDRGSLFMEINDSRTSSWLELSKILEIVTKEKIPTDSIEEQVNLLLKNLRVILFMIEPDQLDNTKTLIDQKRRERIKKYNDSYSSKSDQSE